MPYENVIALVLIILVLLVPLMKWAKDKWMGYTVQVEVNGNKYTASGSTLEVLINALVEASGCTPKHAIASIRRYGRTQLEQAGAWSILADLEEMTLDDYLMYAVKERIITKPSQVPEFHRTDALLNAMRERAGKVRSKSDELQH
jgi:hypothetical protein